MKKFGELPIYFIIIGLILNVIMYFYNKVSFITLMVRSSIIIILFAAIGYFLAYVLNDAHKALANSARDKKALEASNEDTGSTIDIRVNQEDDDELFKLASTDDNEEFVEIDTKAFERLMNSD